MPLHALSPAAPPARSVRVAHARCSFAWHPSNPTGFAPRTPLHALSPAAPPARSVRVAHARCSFAWHPSNPTGFAPRTPLHALSPAAPPARSVRVAHARCSFAWHPSNPTGFAPRTPLHALSPAAPPARSVRVAHSRCSFAWHPSNPTGFAPRTPLHALSPAAPPARSVRVAHARCSFAWHPSNPTGFAPRMPLHALSPAAPPARSVRVAHARCSFAWHQSLPGSLVVSHHVQKDILERFAAGLNRVNLDALLHQPGDDGRNRRVALGPQRDQVGPRLHDVRSETRQALEDRASDGADAQFQVDPLGWSRQTAFLNDAAAFDEHDPIAGRFYFTEQMGIEKDRDPVGAQFVDDAAHQQPAQRVEAGGRLVEKYESRLVQQRLRQPYTLQHALAVAAQRAIGRVDEVHARQQPIDP